LRLYGAALEELSHALGQGPIGAGLGQQAENTSSALVAKRADSGPLQRLDSDQGRFLGAEAAASQPANDQEQENEADVDDRDRRPVEVVDVLGHELAHLVDEQTESDTANDGRDRLSRRAEKSEDCDQRRQQQETSPQHVRNVQGVAAHLRIPSSRK